VDIIWKQIDIERALKSAGGALPYGLACLLLTSKKEVTRTALREATLRTL
jgi:hypothetical protein